ncbi:MAG: M1 family metallopeptidase [Lutibacter sp.]|nr:M1 family metallopeptidase [Lutibacter sp.]
MKNVVFLLQFLGVISIYSQNNTTYWQQHVNYKMNVDVNVNNYQYKGTQQLTYTNNSPDVLTQVFYHLYFNAFQPGSEMDVRLQNIPDPDGRMVTNIGTIDNPRFESRISKLQANEIGYLNIKSLLQNNKKVVFSAEGTILQVTLNKALQPGESTVFDMVFEGQLSVHIRRAGRNNEDGVALSMAQWYPKMAEYDFEGWHADPYIGREFHGVWGDFDVTINIDKKYTVGGTGYLQNPQEIGHGYEDTSKKLEIQKGNTLSWHFVAPNVHDFTWAADPNYIHDKIITKSGIELHFLYKNESRYKKAWKEVQPYTENALDYFSEQIGAYPYKQYSVIQGGDGGMEYAMCTLLAGGETLNSILGTMYHEVAHSWFQQILATNESKHPWMDEGFTTYISTLAHHKAIGKKASKPVDSEYQDYFYAVKYNLNEPLTTHSDRYHTNTAFSIGSYTKGSIFLLQLSAIIGEEHLKTSLKRYFDEFKFKHPTPNDFKRIAEKVSGIQLDWYLNEWTQTTNTIDYAIAKVEEKTITLARVGSMPMPLDIKVEYFDGSKEIFTIPLRMMKGVKPTTNTVLKNWAWAYPTYSFSTKKHIKSVIIDPNGLLADIDTTNNTFKIN